MNNILEWLEQAARRDPAHVAVDDGAVICSYQELMELSKRMGTGICAWTEGKKPVAVLMEKSALTLAVMFGVVYAGGFYVCMDPGMPAVRMKKMLEVLEPEVVIADPDMDGEVKAAGYPGKVLGLRDILSPSIDQARLDEIRRESSLCDRLYATFTSGSTGVPKAIVVDQQAVVQFIEHFTTYASMDDTEIIGNQAPFDFDVSVKDIYAGIRMGATLVLIPRRLFSMPSMLLDYLCEKQVTTLIWAVSALCMISALRGLEYRVPTEVRKVMFSGEVMPSKQLVLWQQALPDAEFINLYGPSEITCNCTAYRVPDGWKEEDKLPIGVALPGRKVFLLDEKERVITGGDQCGEICVCGESISLGYYKNPDETRKKFLFYQFPDGSRERYYRTGDLGVRGMDGNLYFQGRKDFQIKHMGHRIELEEIEHAMQRLEGVEKSCCLFDEKKHRIVAYYTGLCECVELHKRLKKLLPAYMIPGRSIYTEEMPLTKNGKTDRNYFKKLLEGRG